MAMIEGVITINPATGDVIVSTGAAGTVFDALNASQDYGSVVGPQLAEARERIADIARGIAKLIPYIQTNATVATTTTGLATGVVAGAATAPTTGTGTGTVA